MKKIQKSNRRIKMKILQLLKTMMKVSGAWPLGSSKTFQIVKLIFILICPIYVWATTLLYTFFRVENFILTTTAMYVCGGYTIGLTLHLTLFFNINKTLSLFNNLEDLINESQCYIHTLLFCAHNYFLIHRTGINASAFGKSYHETNVEIHAFTKKVFICWSIIMSILISGPFTDGLFQHFTSDTVTWNLLYGASL